MTDMAKLVRYNPWWTDPSAIDKDVEIRRAAESALRFVPELVHTIKYDFEPDNTVVYTVRGHRQVGKTTLIKTQIRNFLRNGVNPWNIMYCPLDIIDSRSEIVDTIETYMKMSQTSKDDSRCYIFLDEASSIKDWQTGIKVLVDAQKLGNCTVLVTGSDSISIRHGSEMLPNRRGRIDDKDHHDKIMRPMKFAEYVASQDDGIRDMLAGPAWNSTERRKMILDLASGRIDHRIRGLILHKERLDHLLYRYMITGGIPLVVNEMIKNGSIMEDMYENYRNGIIGTWNALSKSQILLKNFLRNMIESYGSTTTWKHISDNSGIKDPRTGEAYAATLDDLFVISSIRRYEIGSRKSGINTGRKLYFQDPFLFHIFNGQGSSKSSFVTCLEYIEENAGRIIEGTVASHLLRWLFEHAAYKHKFDHDNHLFYWNDGKSEVDFVIMHGDSPIPIEVKYRKTINYRNLTGMSRFMGRSGTVGGIVISRDEIDTRRNYAVVPASIFLLLV